MRDQDDGQAERLITPYVECEGRMLGIEDGSARAAPETAEPPFRPDAVVPPQSTIQSDPPGHVTFPSIENASMTDAEISERLSRVHGDLGVGLDPVLRRAQQRALVPESW